VVGVPFAAIGSLGEPSWRVILDVVRPGDPEFWVALALTMPWGAGFAPLGALRTSPRFAGRVVSFLNQLKKKVVVIELSRELSIQRHVEAA
jgi:hypothetical protein